jgi:hypothetical protein
VTAVLAGALFLVISLLAMALFALRGEMRGLGERISALDHDLGVRINELDHSLSAGIADMRVDLARIEQKLDDHIADPRAHAAS